MLVIRLNVSLGAKERVNEPKKNQTSFLFSAVTNMKVKNDWKAQSEVHLEDKILRELTVILIPDDICFVLPNVSDFVSFKYRQMGGKMYHNNLQNR